MSRTEILAALCAHAHSLFARGYTVAAGGNLSHREGDGFLMEATGTSFGRLQPTDFVWCRADGTPGERGPVPSKEVSLHAAILAHRTDAHAVVHLHSAASIALAGMVPPTDDGNVLPHVSVYAAMRVGRVPLLEFIRPGTQRLAERVGEVCGTVNALLLSNHGLVTWAPTLDHAVELAEEVEHTARIWLLSNGAARVLTAEQLAELGHKP